MFKKFVAAFFSVVFSAMLIGCGTDMGNDLSSDISSIMDPNPNGSAQSSTPSTNSSITNSSSQPDTNSQTAKISREKAKEIALNHAKVNESEITDYEIELDNEDGKLMYDVSFESNGKEYNYDIDADTGDITNSKNELVD